MGFGSTVQGCRREEREEKRWVLTEFQIYHTHTPIYLLQLHALDIILFAFTVEP